MKSLYNPYLENQAFAPLEPEPAPDSAFDLLSELDGDGKLSSVKQLLQLKDAVNFSKLGELAGFANLANLSSLGDLFGKKDKSLPAEGRKNALASEEATEEGFLALAKKKLRLEELDAGDILLVIIVIYLMIEGDDKVELAITLGILAFLWLIDGKD